VVHSAPALQCCDIAGSGSCGRCCARLWRREGFKGSRLYCAALQAVCCGWVIVLSVLAALWLLCCGGAADLCGAVI